MSDEFVIEFFSVKDPRFKEALGRASEAKLAALLKNRTILRHTEKCCKIYAELYRKRHRKAKEKDARTDCGAAE